MSKDAKALEWLEGNELSYDIWDKKYRHKEESLSEWLDRVSGGDEDLRKIIEEKKFLFGGRALANRGTGINASMFNCYSSGYVEDSLEDILKVNNKIAVTFKKQGGQGLSLSKIRPNGSNIQGIYKSEGIIPFMEIFNTTTSSIMQGGGRKGALLMSLDITHKDASDFITIKTDLDKITKANLSLEIDDEFMEQVRRDYETGQETEVEKTFVYNENETITYKIIPIKLFKLMAKTAWDYGEPGIIFTNMFRNYNLMEYVDGYEIETANPCGEQPLPKDFSCNLGSINLAQFVKNPYTKEASFDWIEFEKVIPTAVRALDDLIDENADSHPIIEHKVNSLNYRNIGLGVMGYATMLIQLGLKYGSEEAIEFTDDLFYKLLLESIKESSYLAHLKGEFPKYDEKMWESSIMKNLLYVSKDKAGFVNKAKLRNCSLISIAPTGSISNMLGVTGGIEPEFAFSYTRKTDNLEESYQVYSKSVKDYLILSDRDTVDLNSVEDLPEYFISSQQVDWVDRINTQSTIQRYVDTAISSTLNLGNEVTVEEVEKIFSYAWEKKLKGITIFRDGCKRIPILSTEKKEEEPAPQIELSRGYIIDPMDDLIGRKRKIQTGCGSLHVLAWFDPISGELMETYLGKGSTGGCNNTMVGLSRLISVAARGGIPLEAITDQLDSTGVCPSYAVRAATKKDTSRGSCCPMAIGKALLDMNYEVQQLLGDDDSPTEENYSVQLIVNKPEKKEAEEEEQYWLDQYKCPHCHSELKKIGGCIQCVECGVYSKCT